MSPLNAESREQHMHNMRDGGLSAGLLAGLQILTHLGD